MAGHRSAAALWAAPFLLLACGPPEKARTSIPDCPGFVVADTTITVAATGGTFNLQGGNSLTFANGAVPAGSSYTVKPYRHETRRVAGVSIDPVQNAPTTFGANVTLRLSYAACPSEQWHQTPHMVRVEGSTFEPVPSTTSTTDRFVDGFLDHLSDYAIGI